MKRTEALDVNGRTYPVNVFIEDRHDATASIGGRSINIRLPRGMSREEQFRQLIRFKQLVRQKLERHPAAFQQPKRAYAHGDTLQVGNEAYLINLAFKGKESSSAGIAGNTISLVISSRLPEEKRQRHIATLISRCIGARRLPEITRRVHELNQKHFRQQFNKVFLKNNRSNWGSCSREGRNINISTRLLFAPGDVIDYVCTHELAHLLEKSHSGRFWELVAQAMPDYREKKRWLRENGSRCFF